MSTKEFPRIELTLCRPGCAECQSNDGSPKCHLRLNVPDSLGKALPLDFGLKVRICDRFCVKYEQNQQVWPVKVVVKEGEE